jgi:hypothetical protein
MYDQASHERAEATKDYSDLITEAASGEGMVNKLSLPALQPWGALVLEPKEKTKGYLWSPTILGESRFVEEGRVTLRCATKGAQIRYTIDGTEPDIKSAIYTDPLVVNETVEVKARAFKGTKVSKVNVALFMREESRKDILRNGNFEDGMTGWEFVNSSNGEAAMKGSVTKRADGKGQAMRIELTKSSGNLSHLRLVQHFTARDGGYYDLLWQARAEQPTTIRVMFQEPVEPHRILRSVVYNVDREWKEFSLRGYNTDRRRKETWSRDIICRVQFDVGVTAGNVLWFDKVRLEEDWLE